MADQLILPETQTLYEMQEEITELQAYANMLNTPDTDGKIGEVTDLTAVMRIMYNAGSSTRIHTSEAFNKYFAEFVKANASELVSRTVQKAMEMLKDQKALAAQEVLDQLSITGASPISGPAPDGAPVFTGSMQAVGYAGEPISYYINAASLPISTITFAAEDMPAGLTLDATSGLLEGTVADAGTHAITIKATNDKGTTSKVLSLIIAERTHPNIPAPTAPMIYGQLHVEAIEGKPFEFQCAAANLPASGVTWSITPDLTLTFPGLVFDTTTGKITGTPTTTGSSAFILRVETSGGDWDEAQYKLEVKPDLPSGNAPTLYALPARTATVGDAFYQQCAGINITPGATWSLDSTATTLGLAIDSTGKITGTPTTTGTYTINVTVTLTDGSSDTKSMALTVS